MLYLSHGQVQNISLREGETVTVEGLGGPDPLPLANQSFLLRGQVIRSPTHQAALRFQSLPPPAGPGTFHFHYQGRPGELRAGPVRTGCPIGGLWCYYSLGGNMERLVTYTGVSMAHLIPPGCSLLPYHPPENSSQRGTDTESGIPGCVHCHSFAYSVNFC